MKKEGDRRILYQASRKCGYLFFMGVVFLRFLFLTGCEDKAMTNPFHKGVEIRPPILTVLDVLDDQSVTLTWTFDGLGGADFNIYRGTEDSASVLLKRIQTTSNSWTDSGLMVDVEYVYQVSAIYSQNESPRSNKRVSRTGFPAPTDLTSQITDERFIRLSWNDNTSFEQGFWIERSMFTQTGFQIFDEVSTDITTYVDSTVSFDTPYMYRVRAYTSYNQSASSNYVIKIIPFSPSNLTSTPISDHKIQLDWEDNCEFEAGFLMERRDGSTSFQQIGETGPGETTYSDSGLTLGQEYSYRVRAFTEESLSNYSNEVTALQTSDYVYVAEGTFIMGDIWGNGLDDELPTHSVTLSSFFISRYETTQAQWSAVMGNDPTSGFGVGPDYPVYNVSWYDILAYCNRRSLAEGLTPAYIFAEFGSNPDNWPVGWDSGTHDNFICNFTANGYRLPTEAEWEYAAKGGDQSRGFQYAGSNNLEDVAWYYYNSDGKSHSTGKKQPNELELFDMSGNVSEWCWDWYDSYYYQNSEIYNPRGPTSGTYRVSRSGYWNDLDHLVRVVNRSWIRPDSTNIRLGFRCVRGVE